MKNARTLAISVAAAALALSLACCGKTEEPVAPEPTAIENETTTEEKTDDKNTLVDTNTEGEGLEAEIEELEQTDDASSATPITDTKRVGTAEYGFTSVPSNWIDFKDVDGNDSAQYCDPSGSYIVSLNVFDIESVPEEYREDFDDYMAANSIWANIENDGAQDVQAASVELAGKPAYQVYGYYPDEGIFLVTWVVTDDAGTIHYVAAEGPGQGLMDIVSLIEQTYSFTE